MGKQFLMALACLGATAAPSAATLTETETAWLNAGWPVVTYARQQKLPLDIVVLPQAKPGDAPLAMGFAEGRCKLVLAMRGNPQAESTLAGIPTGIVGPVVEAMMAHELAHCWRYVQGVWHTLPAGFVDVGTDSLIEDKELGRLWQGMRETRREEGFADLVGLAWTQARHPGMYSQVHAWFKQFRDDQPVPGSHHDTRAWIRLASDGSVFGTGSTPFEQVHSLWQQGLLSDD